MAKSSAPMSTTRPRNACLRSSLPRQRAIAVEGRAGQLAGRPLDVAHVAGQLAEPAVPAGQLAAADGEGRAATGRRSRRPRSAGLGLRAADGVRIDDVARHAQVLVDRLAGDEQVHDLGRALEDAVDPQVAQQLLDRERRSPRAASESAVS